MSFGVSEPSKMASLLQLSKPFKPFTTQQPKQRLLRTFALPARNVIQAAQKQHGAEAKVEAVVSPALAGIVACTLSTSIFAQRAIAEEVAAAVEESGFQLPTTPEEWVTYILFVVVVGLLTVVTGGVSKDWG